MHDGWLIKLANSASDGRQDDSITRMQIQYESQ